MQAQHQFFNLTLMVNHACNLRCSYCYNGPQFNRAMSDQIAETAILQAFHCVKPGGSLDIGFFGGEPLLESRSILKWMDYARSMSSAESKEVSFSLTTNGTIVTSEALQVMTRNDLELSISMDGLPHIHNRHRCFPDGQGSATQVLNTLKPYQALPGRS